MILISSLWGKKIRYAFKKLIIHIIISLTASCFTADACLSFRLWLLLFYAERIPVALPTDSVNAFESEIVDAELKSRRRLIQSGMVIACVARGQASHREDARG